MTVPVSQAAWGGATDGPAAPSVGDPQRFRRVVAAQRELACGSRDSGRVFELLTRSVQAAFDADAAVAAQVQGAQLVVRATVGAGAPAVDTVLGDVDDLVGRAMATGRPQKDLGRTPGIRARVVAPLIHDGDRIGVVTAYSSSPFVFSDDDLDLLATLTDVAASALHGALQSEVQRTASHPEAILEILAEGLVDIDRTGRILFANRGAQRMLDFTWDASSGKTVANSGWTYLNEDGSVRTPESLPGMIALATGEPQHDQVMGVRNKAGQVWWLSVNAVPRFDAEGVVGVLTSFTDISARVAMGEARRAHDRRLRAAQQLTGLAWWSLDVKSGTHEWSDAMFQLVGLEPTAQAPSHDAFITLLHPDDRAAARQLADLGFESGHGEVFRVVHPDGSVHHLQSWMDVDTDESGIVLRVTGATMDVTDREEAVTSLAISQASLVAALELSRTAMWEWDVRTGALTWSDRMFELMGRAAQAPTAHLGDFLESVHPDDRDRMRLLGERTIATGQGEEVIYRVRHQDGSVRHVRAYTDVRTAPDGRVIALWGTAMDITEQAEAAASLAASERHFRVAFDNAPIGMAMIDLTPGNEGCYLRINAALEAMIGYTDAEIRGMSVEAVTQPADLERDRGLIAKLVRGETASLAFEKRYRRKDGATAHAWLTTAVVADEDGKPLYLVSHALDIGDRLREQAELERLALTDTLTGLANRALLNDRLDQALARLQRTGGLCAMLLLDVDRFKLVNDSLGHQMGDALLIEMAARIETVTRADSTVARLGGDEFVVLVEGLREPDELHAIAARLLEHMRRPFNLGAPAESLVTTVSMGISVATSADRSPVDLYREADLALYRAKDSGRDQYALFDDALRARAVARLGAETLLRRALDDDAIVPVFQPIVDLHDGRIVAAEALARLVGTDGRLVLPAEFIDVAEETGLIVEIDARMFERVVAQYARLSSGDRIRLRRMTSNVSARSLEDPVFVDRLRRALVWHSVPGSAIRVELTERSLLTTSAAVRESLERMAALGIQVGLDDFGTGYSALGYLQRFQLQFLKIDRSFVDRLGCSDRDDAVVAAVIDLAHAHDLVVIGEGVETPDQLAALRAMGCDRVQGYLLGRPMPAAALEDLLRADPRW